MKFLIILIHLILCTHTYSLTLQDCKRPIETTFKLGWKKIGHVQLKKLLREIDASNISVQVNRPGNIAALGGRYTAHYNTVSGGSAIHFNNPKNTGLSKRDMQDLCVHELLGSLRYSDESYTYSSIIGFIANRKLRPRQSIALDRHVSSLDLKIQESSSGGDGGMVLGGGDFSGLSIKMRALEVLYRETKRGVFSQNDFEQIAVGIQGCGLKLFRKNRNYPENAYPAQGKGWSDREPARYYAGGPLYPPDLYNQVIYKKYPGVIYLGLGKEESWRSQELPYRYVHSLKKILDKGYNCRKEKINNIEKYGKLTFDGYGNFSWEPLFSHFE